ncbi:PfkB family carbohydrate kinase [Streptomyces sp. TRM68367]|uniref:PfkB family carbohydrate kinase n=1 Tax=Streptomyces sp. TRM68367 TaxID=2758415 RepID=UPI001CA939EA|nr:PfkB family carbohydrate kinase [Streptomyces sp. TRM68367]
MTEPTQATGQAPTLTVIGEALLDMVPRLEAPGDYRARPGGSPFNVAVGLARLGHHTALMARLADNTFGRMLRTHATASRVDLTSCPHAVEPTTLAVVSMDTHRAAQATTSTWTAPPTGSGPRTKPPASRPTPPYSTSAPSPPGHRRAATTSTPPYSACAPRVRR